MVFPKNVLRVAALPLVVGLFAQWTASSYIPKKPFPKCKTTLTENHSFPSLEVINKKEEFHFSPFLKKDLYGFKEALAFKESQGRYTVINDFGYLGKYQFGEGTLKLVGIYNKNHFLKNPELQERAFLANLSRNKWILRREILKFNGKYVNGIKVTESGILAAAHLAGPGSIKKFLRTYGKEKFADGFGTTIEDYMKKFKSYDVSDIKGFRKAKA